MRMLSHPGCLQTLHTQHHLLGEQFFQVGWPHPPPETRHQWVHVAPVDHQQMLCQCHVLPDQRIQLLFPPLEMSSWFGCGLLPCLNFTQKISMVRFACKSRHCSVRLRTSAHRARVRSLCLNCSGWCAWFAAHKPTMSQCQSFMNQSCISKIHNDRFDLIHFDH